MEDTRVLKKHRMWRETQRDASSKQVLISASQNIFWPESLGTAGHMTTLYNCLKGIQIQKGCFPHKAVTGNVIAGCSFCSAAEGRWFSGSGSSTNQGHSVTPALHYWSTSIYFIASAGARGDQQPARRTCVCVCVCTLKSIATRIPESFTGTLRNSKAPESAVLINVLPPWKRSLKCRFGVRLTSGFKRY